MKASKKGPEIDLSKLKPGNLKPPKALGDLYREVRSQHLLPIIVLLVVGLVAIPVLVGRSSDHGKSGGVGRQAAIDGSSGKQVAVDVSKWTPGLLNYKKRLRGAHRIDPFVAQIPGYGSGKTTEGEAEVGVEAPPAPAEVEVGDGPEEAPESTPVETNPSPSGERPGGSESHARESKEESGTVTIDVDISVVHQDGGVVRNPVRRDLPQLTKLPSEAIPALTYVGPSEDGTKAMMAVSSEVTAMVGDSNCVVPAKPCSLLALKVGAPETIVYGPNGLTYRVELARIGDHDDSPGQSDRNHSDPAHESGMKSAPAPREADALIGVGGRRVVERSNGL